MEKKILVAYATKYGATKEIADKIGQVLRQAGLHTDVFPVETVHDLNQYQAVILGSAIYINKWRKEAVEFLKGNEKHLVGRPVWLFSSGPSGHGDPVELVEGWKFPAELKPVVDRIQPRDITVFHGNIDKAKLSFMEKFAVSNIVKKPFGDYRDWNAITSWAASIASGLKAA